MPRITRHVQKLLLLILVAVSACDDDSPVYGKTSAELDALIQGDDGDGLAANRGDDSSHQDSLPVGDVQPLDAPDTAVAGDVDAAGDADDIDAVNGTPCASAFACAQLTSTPFCQLEAQVCVQCLVDFHCTATTNNCDLTTHTCVEESCVPGTTSCQGNFLKTCKAGGKGFDVSECPDAKPVCAADACHVCEPSQKFCKEPAIPGQPSLQVMQCDGSGDAAGVVADCKGKEVCQNAMCSICTPGAKRCWGQKAQVCSSDGSEWKLLDDCFSKNLSCLLGLCVNPCGYDLNSITNVGCDFWAVDLDNAKEQSGGKLYDAQNAQFSVIVSNTAAFQAQVTVTLGPDKSAPGAQTKTWAVPAKGSQVIDLPDKSWGLPNQNQDGSSVNAMAYRIQSTQRIVAYQFNPLAKVGVRSSDASLLVQTGSLGKQYWIVSGAQLGTKFRSTFTVVAAMPGNTTVTVVVSAPTIAGVGVKTMSLGDKQIFTLKQGQVLNVESNKAGVDLTGSWVHANKDVAVFGGSQSSTSQSSASQSSTSQPSASPGVGSCIPNPKGGVGAKVCAGTTVGGGSGKACTQDSQCDPACCADHLEEQLFPIKAWGKQYVAARLSSRGKEKDTWRIIASENGTKVMFTPSIGVTVPTLNQGQFYEFETTADFVITASKPVLVAQYMASAYATMTTENPSCTSDASCKSQHGVIATCEATGLTKMCVPIGDPSLILDVATMNYLKAYSFVVPNTFKLNYITVIAAKGATVILDNLTLVASGFKAIAGSTWTVARLAVGPGNHRLTSDKAMGLFVYGYGEDASYGYPGGAGF